MNKLLLSIIIFSLFNLTFAGHGTKDDKLLDQQDWVSKEQEIMNSSKINSEIRQTSSKARVEIYSINELQKFKDSTIKQQLAKSGVGIAQICIPQLFDNLSFCFIEKTLHNGNIEFLITENDYMNYLNHPISESLDFDFIIVDQTEFVNLAKLSTVKIAYDKNNNITLSFPQERVIDKKCEAAVIAGAIGGGLAGAATPLGPEGALLGAIGGALHGAVEGGCFDKPTPKPPKKQPNKIIYEEKP